MTTFFSSTGRLAARLGKVFYRFPLAILFAIAGTIAALILNIRDNPIPDALWMRLLLCSVLGLVFSISFRLVIEKRKPGKQWRLFLFFILILLLAGYFFSLPGRLQGTVWYRFFLMAAFGHLLVAVAPFIRNTSVADFWYYNKTLFLTFLRAVLYSAVLFAGICIAVFAVNELFDLHIPDEIYFRIWIVMAGIVNTTIFLAGIPSLEESTTTYIYPKGLKIFTGFVLIPLVSLYVVILLIYELKIIFQAEWPNGWVSNLVIAFAVSGILSLLLIYPIRKDRGNQWIVWYGRCYYLALIPLTVLLFFAIGIRINDYGFTEERFLVLVTGIWLAFIVCYFIFSKKGNIKVIPFSLMVCIVISLIFITPVCLSSQQKRLQKILIKNDLLENNYIRQVDKPLSFSTGKNITSIIQYLYKNHGVSAVQPFFKADLSKIKPSVGSYRLTDSALHTVGMEAVWYNRQVWDKNGRSYFSLSIKNSFLVETAGYDYYLSGHLLHASANSTADNWVLNKGSLIAKLHKKDTLVLKYDTQILIRIPLDSFFHRVIRQYAYNRTSPALNNDLICSGENTKIKVKLILQNLNGYAEGDNIDYNELSVRFNYLIRIK